MVSSDAQKAAGRQSTLGPKCLALLKALPVKHPFRMLPYADTSCRPLLCLQMYPDAQQGAGHLSALAPKRLALLKALPIYEVHSGGVQEDGDAESATVTTSTSITTTTTAATAATALSGADGQLAAGLSTSGVELNSGAAGGGADPPGTGTLAHFTALLPAPSAPSGVDGAGVGVAPALAAGAAGGGGTADGTAPDLVLPPRLLGGAVALDARLLPRRFLRFEFGTEEALAERWLGVRRLGAVEFGDSFLVLQASFRCTSGRGRSLGCWWVTGV